MNQCNQIGIIHSIETFGTVDGPGTRMVVFLKGCPLRCKYCHNPDTWKMTGGKEMSVSEIYEKYVQIKEFVNGITISGGEPLLQLDFLIELTKFFHEKNVHVCVDTSGICFDGNEKYNELIKYVDLFLLDIKHIEDKEHIELTGMSNKNILKFEEFLDRNNKKIWLRHVLVEGITLNNKYLYELGYYLGQFNNIEGLEVLPYHKMGIPKYEQLKIDYPLKNTRETTKEEAINAKKLILFAMKKRKEEIQNSL